MTAEEFHRVRQQWGLTQTQMADRLGVSRQAVWKWETGQRRVPRIVIKLVDAYRCSPDVAISAASAK